jgi:hypothetical protein
MSFLKKRFGKSKAKSYRADSDLKLQKGLDDREDSVITSRTVVKDRRTTSLRGKISILEQKLNSPDTRREPPKHIDVIRKLAENYLKLGNEEFEYFGRAENLYKQFNVLYPLHMERIDWITWIEASTKAKLIREARRLLEEARLLFPGDEELDRIETAVLHVSETAS